MTPRHLALILAGFTGAQAALQAVPQPASAQDKQRVERLYILNCGHGGFQMFPKSSEIPSRAAISLLPSPSTTNLSRNKGFVRIWLSIFDFPQ